MLQYNQYEVTIKVRYDALVDGDTTYDDIVKDLNGMTEELGGCEVQQIQFTGTETYE